MSDMGTFKKSGIPIMPHMGSIFGDTYFIDYRNGLIANTGKSPDKAITLLSDAYGKATSNKNDAIFIDGDQTVTETEGMISWSKNRIHTYGCNGPPPGAGYGAGAKVSWSTLSGASHVTTLQNTGVRNTFTGIKFIQANTTATALYGFQEAGEYNRYHNCEFYMGTLLTTAGTAEVLMNGDSSQFYGCTFGDLVNERGASSKQRPNVLLNRTTVSGKVCRDGWFEDCRFLHKAAHEDVCFVYGSGATDVERSLVFKNCVFFNCVLATADPADAINFGAAQTNGDVLVINSHGVNITAIAGASLNVYYGSNTAQTTDGVSEEIAA